MHSKVSSDWLPSYIKATRPVLEIFKMAGYTPDSPQRLLPFRMKMLPPMKLEFLRRFGIYKITRRHESEAIVMIRQLAASYHQSQRIRSYLHQLF